MECRSGVWPEVVRWMRFCRSGLAKLFRCKRGFGSPRIWIPHPKTLADLDDPKRGFGSPADLDPSIYFVCDRLEYDEVEFWEPNPRTPKRGFGSPADLDPDSQRIVEDRFRQVHLDLWLTVTDRLFW